MAKTARRADLVRKNPHGGGCARISGASCPATASDNDAQRAGRGPDPAVIAECSEELDEAMKGIDVAKPDPKENAASRRTVRMANAAPPCGKVEHVRAGHRGSYRKESCLALLAVFSLALGARDRHHNCLEVAKLNLKAARSVRDADQWQNPYLVVYPDAIQLISGPARKRTMVPVARLEKALRALPLSDWPYGSVVAVQQVGVRGGAYGSEEFTREDRLIMKNQEAAERLLRKLCIIAEPWPSA